MARRMSFSERLQRLDTCSRFVIGSFSLSESGTLGEKTWNVGGYGGWWMADGGGIRWRMVQASDGGWRMVGASDGGW